MRAKLKKNDYEENCNISKVRSILGEKSWLRRNLLNHENEVMFLEKSWYNKQTSKSSIHSDSVAQHLTFPPALCFSSE